jgi:two-component system NtrC family sensor kinase
MAQAEKRERNHGSQAATDAERTLGLRAQLILGVGSIFAVAALTLGFLTWWALIDQRTERQLELARHFATNLTAVVDGWLDVGKRSRDAQLDLAGNASLRQFLMKLSARSLAIRVRVHDPHRKLLADSSSAPSAPEGSARLLRRAALMREQLIDVAAGKPIVSVVTPLSPGRGYVQLWMPWSDATSGLPRLFWLLVLLDGLLLMLFVRVVLTSTVIRPIDEMEQAAARIASGDLDLVLAGRGPREMRSLAGSFNQMTRALKAQLERLELQQRSLIRSEKMVSVGHLAAGIAHEVGNPLQAVVGLSDLLASRLSDDERSADIARRIEQEAQRIHTIIGQLLEYSRPVSEETNAVHWSEVVEQVEGLLRPQKRFRGIDLQLREIDQLPAVAAVAPRLVQVLLNLLLNAADAIHSSCDQSIEQDSAGRVSISAETDAGKVRLLVENDGPSIDPGQSEQIFEPFYTTKAPGSGTGLGLAVSRAIIESLGGTLALESNEPVRFVVELSRFK